MKTSNQILQRMRAAEELIGAENVTRLLQANYVILDVEDLRALQQPFTALQEANFSLAVSTLNLYLEEEAYKRAAFELGATASQ